MISDPANPDAWFILAKDRLEKADALYEQFGASWSGVELLQEAAERYLKGFLVARGWNLVKTHDLNRLLASACEFDNSFSCFAPPPCPAIARRATAEPWLPNPVNCLRLSPLRSGSVNSVNPVKNF
jgi:hypothetical protein